MASWPIDQTLTLEQALAAPYLPGFQQGEQVIAKAWLASAGRAYQAFAFNVRVGQGVSAPPDASESAQRFVRLTTQKRIDIVALGDAGAALWEVKIQANLGALGQLQGYVHLWGVDHPTVPVTAFGVLCHLISLDTAAVFTRYGMAYYVFPDIVLPPLLPLTPSP